jgi:hypothetical protein
VHGRQVRQPLCRPSPGEVEKVLVAPVKFLEGGRKMRDGSGVGEEPLRVWGLGFRV